MNYPTHAALADLSIDNINVRKTGRGAEPQFTSSIRAKGVITALIVRPIKDSGKFTISDGGKRFEALSYLKEHGESADGIAVTDAYPVPIRVRAECDVDAHNTSLAANIHAPMHPVDEHEAFAQLVADGWKPEEIAADYGLTRRQVDQRLALAELAPEIRKAWRAGEISAESATLFTKADHGTQARAFAKLSKSGNLDHSHWIRQELKIDTDVGRMIEFIGVDVYEARGGKVARDLFGTDHRASDRKLAVKMVAERIKAECERLVSEGWGWAIERPDSSYSFGTITVKPRLTKDEKARMDELQAIYESEADDGAAEIEMTAIGAGAKLRAYSAEDKARSGCFVKVSRAGALEIDYGRVKPEERKKEEARERSAEKKKAAAKSGAEPEERTSAISSSLAHRLSCTLTSAASAAIALDHDLAFSVGLAALMTERGSNTSVRLSNGGMEANRIDTYELDFCQIFETVQKKPLKERLALFAKVVGTALDFQDHSPEHVPPRDDADVAAVCNAIAPKDIGKALIAAFNVDDYFTSAPAAFAIEAIVEIKGKGIPIPKKKADIAALAAAEAKRTGWLPVQLRTAAYAGPGAKKPPAAKPAAKAAAKAKKK